MNFCEVLEAYRSARTRHNEPALIRRQLFLAAPNAPSLDRCRARTAGGIQPALGDNQGDKAKHKDIPPALKGLTTLAKIPFGSLRHCLAPMACRQPNALGQPSMALRGAIAR